MRRFWVVLAALALVAAAGVSIGAVVAPGNDECAIVNANGVSSRLMLDAAEKQGGLTNGQKTWISNYRGVITKALAFCAGPVTTQPPTTTATTQPSTTQPPTTQPPTTQPPPSGAKPNASNTGVPPGVTLQASGTITVTQAGTVIQNKLVTGCILVQASNVTIKNTKVLGNCFNAIDIRPWDDGDKNLTITDVEVDGRGADNCIAFYNYTATRVNLHDCADGAKAGDNTTIRDSYIWRLFMGNGAHADAVQSTGGSGTTITNTVLGGPTMLGDEFGPLVDILIQGSWLEGGLWGGWNQSTQTVPSGMRVLSNVISQPVVYVSPGTTWTGNTKPDGSTFPHP